jgi:arginyl-tRNA synthetase
MKTKIVQEIEHYFEVIGIDPKTVRLHHPANPKYGDYSTNIAFGGFKIAGIAGIAGKVLK